MTLLKIARMGHPVLRRRAEDIPDPTARNIRTLVDDMIETMEDSEGAGLAAPQVHVGRRVIIFSAPPERADGEEAPEETVELTTLINPEFDALTDETAMGWEGCLSIPGLTGSVPRFTRIRYRGLTPSGRRIEREATGFHARVVQHEIDHLDGILFTMRMPDLGLLMFNEEMRHFMVAEDDAPDEDAPEDES